jgi:hypothetical protein
VPKNNSKNPLFLPAVHLVHQQTLLAILKIRLGIVELPVGVVKKCVTADTDLRPHLLHLV